jgi:hypothetical protein
MTRTTVLLILSALIGACSCDPTPAPVDPDAGLSDAGRSDAGEVAPPDAGDTWRRGDTCQIRITADDRDGDGLTDELEALLGTDPDNPDSDGDGVLDGCEDINRNGRRDSFETDANNADSDGDGISDGDEDRNHNGQRDEGETYPLSDDSDLDGIADGDEDRNHNGVVDPGETDPLSTDSDGDGIHDAIEDANANGVVDPGETDPASSDSDGDGVSDGVEDRNQNGVVDAGETDPRNTDSDGDCLPDGVEDRNGDGVVDVGELDPLGTDSDGDGIGDGVEDVDCDGVVDAGETDPGNVDSDGDGLDDGLEDRNRNGVIDARETDPRSADSDADGVDDNIEDTDMDGLVDLGETDPINPDSDNDGVEDGAEDRNGNGVVDAGEMDPLDPDSDQDGLIDGYEDRNGNGVYDAPGPGEELTGETDPLEEDTDGDGLIDGLDEDLNGNGVVDAGETNPRVADAENASGVGEICSTRNLTPTGFWFSEEADLTVALPEAVHAGLSVLQVGGSEVGSAFADAATAVAAATFTRTPSAGARAAAAGQKAFTQNQLDASAIAALGLTVAPASPRVFETADGLEAAVSTLEVNGANQAIGALRNAVVGALRPGVQGLPAADGAAGTSFRIVLSTIYRSDDAAVTLVAMAPFAGNESTDSDRDISMRNLAGGTSVARFGARYRKDCVDFEIRRASNVDFLWVVDSSGSMSQEQAAVVAAANALVSELNNTNLAWRIGVTTTDANGALRGGNFTTNPGTFVSRVQVGTSGSGYERGLHNARRGLERALPRGNGAAQLRADAPTVTVILSDEEDQDAKDAGCYQNRGCAQNFTQPWVNFFNGQGGQFQAPPGFDSPGSVFTIINTPEFGCGSAQIAHAYDLTAIGTGGRSESICGRNGQLDYSGLMQDIAQAAAGIASNYRLNDARPIASTFKVGIRRGNGPITVLNRSRTLGFDFDDTQNALILYGELGLQNGDEMWVSFRYWLPPACPGGCPDGQICHPDENRCVPDPDCGGGCLAGFTCDPDQGLCIPDPECGQTCTDREACVQHQPGEAYQCDPDCEPEAGTPNPSQESIDTCGCCIEDETCDMVRQECVPDCGECPIGQECRMTDDGPQCQEIGG